MQSGSGIMAATVSTPVLPHRPPLADDAAASGPRAALTSTKPPHGKLTRAQVLLPSLVAVLAAAVGSAIYVTGRGKESTDDAQVEGRVASVSARVSGQVSHVLMQDNQIVEASDPLVEVDDADLRAKLDAARADLAQAQASSRVVAEAAASWR